MLPMPYHSCRRINLVHLWLAAAAVVVAGLLDAFLVDTEVDIDCMEAYSETPGDNSLGAD